MQPRPSPPADPEHLLGQDAFVRGLARQLLHDPNAADDAVQETWLAALQRPPAGRHPTSLRAFLATLLRRLVGRARRGERREQARRQRLVAEVPVPSPEEILQRERARAQVVQAVLALPPEQRDVVLLRFFEFLPPRAIARRLGVPVETVRTRSKRALATLRLRLDHEAGGRVAWAAWLLPFDRGPALPPWLASPLPSVVSGGISVSAQKFAVAGIAVGLLAVAWFTLGPPAAGGMNDLVPPAPARPELAALPTTDGAPSPAAAAGTGNDTRRRAPAADASDTGSLLVRVVYADGAPAEGVVVEVGRSGSDELFEQPRGRSDATGRVQFAELAPGRVRPTYRRGGQEADVVVTVVAGATVEAELRLEPGFDLRGVVVDGQARPIAGAEIVVCDWGGGEAIPVAETAADGSFALRALGTHCHVGARATGFASSPLRQFTASPGAKAEVRLVLDAPGLDLHGVVLGPDGHPVPDAVVRVGSTQQNNQQLPEGGLAMGPRPELVRTAADGTFVAHHLRPGSVPVAVRARRLAPVVQNVTLAAGTRQRIVVHLLLGVTVAGRVVDGTGAPLRATLAIGHWEDLAHRYLRARDDGTFVVEGMAPGSIPVRASFDGKGHVVAVLTATVGETVTWHPVLDGGLMLRGRVVDTEGRPLAKVMIEARQQRPQPGDPWYAFVNSDADGRFVLENCAEGSRLTVSARRQSVFPELTLHDVVPGSEELVVTMPKEAWVTICGTILDPDGTPLPVVSIAPSMRGSASPAETADPVTGAFRFGPYPPGAYELYLQAAGYPALHVPRRTVGPNETWDLGELRFQHGGTFLGVAIGSDVLVAAAELTVRSAAGELVQPQPSAAGQLRAGPLAPGSYRAYAAGAGIAATAIPFEILSGRETRIDVPLQPGIKVPLRARLPAGAAAESFLEFAVHDPEGALVATHAAKIERGEAEVRLGLAVGAYRVVAIAGGYRGTAPLVVPATGDAVSPTIELRPQ